MESPAARLFDAMADDYDRLEPWYEHLYALLHPIVLEALAPARPGARALDAGCGSGFQTALLERLGYRTHGVDLAPRLLAAARRRLPSAAFTRGGVEALPYGDASFAAVCCCGSTLSFVDEPAAALRELGRVLAPGGRLLVEVEHRWSLDLAWMLASALGGDPLNYGVSVRDAARALVARPRGGCTVTYPGYGRLRLFTRGELSAMLGAAGLRAHRWWGIHSFTNLIPSTVLHRDALPPPIARLYARLRAVDARVSPTSFGAWLANSLVVLADRPSEPVSGPGLGPRDPALGASPPSIGRSTKPASD